MPIHAKLVYNAYLIKFAHVQWKIFDIVVPAIKFDDQSACRQAGFLTWAIN
ncbi:hypothetical protein DAI22_11g114200 [Oryza sativa Japonica Group]|nr:hypothetical protein DAI22_11g114200 [Oryza sativa Japonica Group]